MSTPNPQKSLLVHASRVVPVGGLHAFTAAILRSLAGKGQDVSAIVGPQTEVPAGVERIEAPSIITMQRDVSLMRSIYGFLYSILLSWRYRRQRVLATTLLGFPMHRNQVITLHDVRPLLMPYTWAQGLYYRYVMPRVLRGVKGVLTVSQSSKEEIARLYPVATGKIFVVPNVIQTVPRAKIRSGTPDEPEYLLMVNANFRHKNAVEVLEHHALWRPRYRLKVLAGGGRYEAKLREQVERRGLTDHVDFLPCVSDKELAALYVHAAALVFPSVMEGFGIPPLEAMAYGTPVIVSDISVFHEVMRDAPIFVALKSRESWQRAFAVLQSDEVREHVARGKSVAAEFTQERMDDALNTALNAIWPENAEGTPGRALRVMIDTTTVTRQKAGVGVYVKNLVDHLMTLPGPLHYYVVAQSDDPDFFHDGLPHVTMLRVPAKLYRVRPLRMLLEQIWLPMLALWHGIDVLHSVHYSFPLISPRAKRTVTIHDMTFVTMPEVHERSKLPYFRFFIRAATRRAEKMIFVSESSLRDCQRLFPFANERASVVYLGLGENWYDTEKEAQTALKAPEKYVLFVGTIEPRKNIVRLITAFTAVAQEFPEYALVIAGMKGWKSEEVFAAAGRSSLQGRIVFTGFISEPDKHALMLGATVFAYPSLYEGFGIPVLEAMACGVPTLTSNISSIPEITGDAALLVNPESTEEITQGLRLLLASGSLREELRHRGRARAQMFTWKKTAEETLALYRSATGRKES